MHDRIFRPLLFVIFDNTLRQHQPLLPLFVQFRRLQPLLVFFDYCL